MTETTIQQLAATVDNAARNRLAISQLSLENNFDIDESYAIQATSIQRRLDRGERLVGLKMGFTSEAKMKQMGVSDMIWGRLTDDMMYGNGDMLPFGKFIHPRAEPEVAFFIKKEITEEVSLEDLPNYVSAVAPAIEIIDSRYENFKFSLEDVIADNCSSAGFALGEWLPADTPVNHRKVSLTIDGAEVQSGSTDAILGDPWKALQACTRLAAKYGQPIPERAIVLAGAATSAVYLKERQEVRAVIDGLGEVKLRT